MERPDWIRKLQTNVASVRADIAQACRRVGREPAGVRLVGVTKYVSAEVPRALLTAGVEDIGESRVQQLVTRARDCGPASFHWPPATENNNVPQPRWHMIGHLQRNKVGLLLQHARILHSLDSERLARSIEQHAAARDVVVDAFVEVNVTSEASKQGIAPEALPALAETVADCSRIRLRGLMTMAPYDPDPEAARPHFARLRELLAELRKSGAVGPECVELSMGMSQDYAVAVEEGATFVRVGSVLFGGLPTCDPRHE